MSLTETCPVCGKANSGDYILDDQLSVCYHPDAEGARIQFQGPGLRKLEAVATPFDMELDDLLKAYGARPLGLKREHLDLVMRELHL